MFIIMSNFRLWYTKKVET